MKKLTRDYKVIPSDIVLILQEKFKEVNKEFFFFLKKKKIAFFFGGRILNLYYIFLKDCKNSF